MHFSRGPQQGYSTSFSPCLEETDERGVVLFFFFGCCCFVSHMLPENWTNCLKSCICHLDFWFTVANHDKRTDADEQNHSVLCL